MLKFTKYKLLISKYISNQYLKKQSLRMNTDSNI